MFSRVSLVCDMFCQILFGRLFQKNSSHRTSLPKALFKIVFRKSCHILIVLLHFHKITFANHFMVFSTFFWSFYKLFNVSSLNHVQCNERFKTSFSTSSFLSFHAITNSVLLSGYLVKWCNHGIFKMNIQAIKWQYSLPKYFFFG